MEAEKQGMEERLGIAAKLRVMKEGESWKSEQQQLLVEKNRGCQSLKRTRGS